MWQQKWNLVDPDSDQSISDDEELGPDWHGNCVSLATSVSKKEGSEILLRLEQLKGTREYETETGVSSGTQASPVFEDDVEMPDFYNEDNFLRSPEKAIVEDEENDPAEKNDNFYGWSSIGKEAEALIHLNEDTSSQSKTKKFSKGVNAKGKVKFSFRHRSSLEGKSSFPTSKSETKLTISEILGAIENRTEILEDIHDEQETTFHEESLEHEHSEQSMAALLDGLQGWNSQPREKIDIKLAKNGQLAVKRSKFPARGRIVNSEVSISREEYIEPSSDSETSDEDLEIGLPETKKHTMADQFREVFDATFSNDNPNSKSGLSWRLQQVIQTEREQETVFLAKLGNGEHLNESNCIHVEVMSRNLEGKLTVCRCFVDTGNKSLKGPENVGLEKIIIFNNRVSADVELEVGSHLRVHRPWLEVQVEDNKSIILATYYSGF